MTLLKFIFGDSKNKNTPPSKVKWIALTNLQQLDEIISLSFQKPVVIFKHSTRCSISRMVLKQFESEFDLEDVVIPYFLDLLSYRVVSDEIASRFQVVHQSPQLLLIREGKSVYDASHNAIDVKFLEQFLR